MKQNNNISTSTNVLDDDVQNNKWSSNFSFQIAIISFAIGLSNIWRFPYSMGQNGGGAFLICYLIATIVLAIPAIMVELIIGRAVLERGGFRLSPTKSTIKIIEDSKKLKRKTFKKMPIRKFLQKFIPYIYSYSGVLSSIFILAYYFTMSGYTSIYIFLSAKGSMLHFTTQDQALHLFEYINSNPIILSIGVILIAVPAIMVVSLGVKRGIEFFSKLFMAFILLFAIVLFLFALFSKGFSEAVKFMFTVDFSKIRLMTIIDATGQALFSISAGFCGILVYSTMADDRKLERTKHIVSNSIILAFANTMFSLVIGVSIFSLVFTKNLSPSNGPSLVFGVLPLILNQMMLPRLMSILFFLMMYFAGITTIFNLIAVVAKWIIDFGVKRELAVILSGSICAVLNVFSILGLGVWKDVRLIPYGPWKHFDILNTLDSISTAFLLPANIILSFIIMGWFVAKEIKKEMLRINNDIIYYMVDIFFKIIAPTLMFLVMISLIYYL